MNSQFFFILFYSMQLCIYNLKEVYDMKKYLRLGIVVVIATLFQPVSANGQIGWIEDIFLQIEDTTCTTEHCDVVLRQYTGLFYVGWKLSIRCLNSNGSWGSWQVWEDSGVYSGTLCGQP